MNRNGHFLRKFLDGYNSTAVILLNVALFILVLNAFLSAMFIIKDYLSRDPVSTKYDHSTLNAIYQKQGLNEREIKALLRESWSRPYIYEPFTQFTEGPYRGAYLNVDTKGFRITKNQGTWPPPSETLNIFLFGGSTTFGYGVPDDQTIASHLQEYLTAKLGRDVRVYNFGRGSYYSTQERILYEELLASGFVPDVAIFIDGLNDFYYNNNEPEFTSRFRELMARKSTGTYIVEFLQETAIGRAAKGFREWFPKSSGENDQIAQRGGTKRGNFYKEEFSNPKVINAVINRYLKNKVLIEAVSRPFDIKPVFVWQPVPTYLYDLHYHPFSEGGFGQHSWTKYGYEQMAKVLNENPPAKNFLWCASIQEEARESLYIDKVHYSAGFSKRFARTIADILIERRLMGL